MNTKEFLRKAQFPALLAAGACPIGAVLLALHAPNYFYLAWLFPAATVLLALPFLRMGGKQRLPWGIGTGLVFLLSGMALIWILTHEPRLLAVPALYSLLLLCTLPMASWKWNEEPPGPVFYTGIFLHLAAQILLFAYRGLENSALEPAVPLLNISFLIFFGGFLLSRNRTALAAAACDRPIIPASMRRNNRLLVFGFFLLLTLLSASALLASVFQGIYRWIMGVIAFLLSLRITEDVPPVSTLLPTETVPITEPDNFMTGEHGDLAYLLQRIVMGLFRFLLIPALIICGILLLLAVLRSLRRLMSKVGNILQQYAAAAGEDYEDQISDTRDSPEPEAVPPPTAEKISLLQLRKLSAQEKIRYRYRRLRRRHPHWLISSTARENLPADAAPLYEQARYSDQCVTNAEAAAFLSKTKRL